MMCMAILVSGIETKEELHLRILLKLLIWCSELEFSEEGGAFGHLSYYSDKDSN